MSLCYMDFNVLYWCFGSIRWFFYKKCASGCRTPWKYVATELITSTIENTLDKYQGEENIELFCYCKTPYDDIKPYVGCNDGHCSYKWIYFTCAKIKKTKARSVMVMQILKKKK